MNLEFPYQLVAFIGPQPAIGEPVYSGTNGWYPQIALKRRFKMIDIDEDDMLADIERYCHGVDSFDIQTGDLASPDRMPVRVIQVAPDEPLMQFHQNFITHMGNQLVSRYPEWDGHNYYPHITAEFGGKAVIDTQPYANKKIHIQYAYVLKDVDDENSVAYARFQLGKGEQMRTKFHLTTRQCRTLIWTNRLTKRIWMRFGTTWYGTFTMILNGLTFLTTNRTLIAILSI
jgi:hypothetical protein